jgi:hypothetical protein
MTALKRIIFPLEALLSAFFERPFESTVPHGIYRI